MRGVGFVDVDLAGGHTAVKKALHVPLHQQIEHIFRDIAQVINAVAVALELLHQFLHPAAGAQDVHPVIQHTLNLKGAALLLGAGQHPLVGLKAGDKPGVQQLPLLAAKGQLVHLLLHVGIAEAVHQILLGVKIDHNAAKIKYDVFVHCSYLYLYGLHFQWFPTLSITQQPGLHQAPPPRIP